MAKKEAVVSPELCKKLTAAIANGDRQAESELFELFQEQTLNLTLRKVGWRKEVADDITQEALIAVIQAIKTKVIDNLIGFIHTVLENKIIDWYARRKFESIDQKSEESAPSPHQSVIKEEERNLLAKCFRNLDIRSRRVVYMRYVRGDSYKKIGRRLGITADNARQIHTRAIDRLREILSKTLEFLSQILLLFRLLVGT
jgi:RNA polymerase sigma-70 factor (ECF subfamily)